MSNERWRIFVVDSLISYFPICSIERTHLWAQTVGNSPAISRLYQFLIGRVVRQDDDEH